MDSLQTFAPFSIRPWGGFSLSRKCIRMRCLPTIHHSHFRKSYGRLRFVYSKRQNKQKTSCRSINKLRADTLLLCAQGLATITSRCPLCLARTVYGHRYAKRRCVCALCVCLCTSCKWGKFIYLLECLMRPISSSVTTISFNTTFIRRV